MKSHKNEEGKVLTFRKPEDDYQEIICSNVKIMQENKLNAWKKDKKGVKYPKGALALRAIRSKMGLLQSEFAALWDVKASTITKWENGRARPSKHTLIVMQRGLSPDLARFIILTDFNYEIKHIDYDYTNL